MKTGSSKTAKPIAFQMYRCTQNVNDRKANESHEESRKSIGVKPGQSRTEKISIGQTSYSNVLRA
jgi:hypothetical protein